jgi:cytosine/adenosine deaminase-related metal-dependent hydrolase
MVFAVLVTVGFSLFPTGDLMTTLIRNATVIAWRDGRHVVIENGVVAFRDDTIVHVGESYDDPVTETIDGTGRIVAPGFVNSHLHLTDTPFTKGYLEDNVGVVDRPNEEYSANLYRALPAIRNATDPDAQVAAAVCAIAECLRSGSTTIMEMAYDEEIMGGGEVEPVERVATAAGEAGIRCYTGPRYRKFFYRERPDGSIQYDRNPSDGRERFEKCKKFVREWDGRYDGRLKTFLAPGQIDTCDPDLLRETRKAAEEIGCRIHLHAGQSLQEYRLIKKTHGLTTIEYMAETGLLGQDFMIGHGQWLTESGDASDLKAEEIEMLTASQSTIVHLPWCKARRGGTINSIEKYRKLGFRQSLGTDTFPYDMFNEMRIAATVCKVVEKSANVAFAPFIYSMATAGGADALGRPDLGRLAVGAKADILLIRIDTPKAAPVYDPFLFMVYTATGDDVDSVLIDGKMVVRDGRLLTINVPNAVNALNEAAKRVRPRIAL